MEKPVEDAQKRYKEILNIIEGDERAENFLEKLVGSAHRYVKNTVKMQAYNKLNKWDPRYNGNVFEAEKHRERLGELDEIKKRSHEGLISNLNMFNRYLFTRYPEQTPYGGIYSLQPDSIKDRIAVGDWAGYLYKGLSSLNKPSEQKNE